jgi:hypothetical protein
MQKRFLVSLGITKAGAFFRCDQAVSGVQSLPQPCASTIINYGTSMFPGVDSGRPIQ